MKSKYIIQRFLARCLYLAKKKGEKYKCEDCGLVVLVQDPCGCEIDELVCCGTPMKQVKETKAPTATKASKTKAKPQSKK